MHNKKICEKINNLSKSITSLKNERIILRKISRCEIIELNETIQPKIDQNKKERIASWNEGKDKTIGSKILK